MSYQLRTVESRRDFNQFVHLPWMIYRDDPYWVAPLLSERINKLDKEKNPYWQDAERQLWMVLDGKRPVGTIAAFIDHRRQDLLQTREGLFGFFESIPDEQVSRILLDAAADWLRQREQTMMVGPYNPSPSDEVGILVEGFDSRPAVLEAHTPRYYPAFMESYGMKKYNDLLARLYQRLPGVTLEQAFPEKLRRIAEIVSRREDVKIRSIRTEAWEDEIRLACQIYNQALASLPGYVPISEVEFSIFAHGLRSLIDPGMAMIAEVSGEPVGFAIALPDINEALQHVNGRLGPLGLLRLWWYARRLKRVSFKILVMRPEFQKRGIEALLIFRVVRTIWERGFTEVDMSLTGEENIKSTLYQEHLGMPVYRRYRIYSKEL
jgi:GNAT superfamily N-acetyltransferase